MDDQFREVGSRANDASSRARERAQAHRAAGRLRDAAIFQLNGLAHDPSDAALLTEHVAVVFALVDQCQVSLDFEEAGALLSELERTLSGLLERVDPDLLDGVREHLRAVDRKHSDLLATARSGPKSAPNAVETKHEAALARLTKNAWDWSVPQGDAAAEKLAAVASLLEYVDETQPELDRAVYARLKDHVDVLRRAVSLDEACGDADQVLKAASNEHDHRVSLAMLQQAEASLRGALPMVRTLDQARQENLLRKVDAVSKALDGVVSAQREQRSRGRWKAHLHSISGEHAEALRWAPDPFAGGRRHCDTQLQRLQRLMDSAGEVIRELDDPATRRDAGAHIRMLNDLTARAATAQREAYARWALSRVEHCFERASQYIKVTGDDEERMGDTIVDLLGEVNPAMLSTEASRAYSEVLEYFLSKLYAPGKDKGFNKSGARLNVLRRLAMHEKSTVTEF